MFCNTIKAKPLLKLKNDLHVYSSTYLTLCPRVQYIGSTFDKPRCDLNCVCRCSSVKMEHSENKSYLKETIPTLFNDKLISWGLFW